MTEVLLTHILILSYQEKVMSFKSKNKIWDPQNLIDTAHDKKQGNGILYGMFVVIVIFSPKIFCVYKGILFYHSSFAKFIWQELL